MPGSGFANTPAGGAVQPCPNQPPKHWLEIELVDSDGQPVASEEYKVTLVDGSVVRGYLDKDGFERIDQVQDPGQCQVTFPQLDPDDWQLQGTGGPKGAGPGQG
jgi:hypothetical protein